MLKDQLNFDFIINKLINSDNPCIKYKVLVNVLGEDPKSKKILNIRNNIKKSNLVRKLLHNIDSSGKIFSKNNIYDKWQGAHWILATLSDIGYPEGDKELLQVKEQVFEFWLSKYFFNEFEAKTKKDSYRKDGVPFINGKHRRCASQQGYALFYLIKLDLIDERIHSLAERLLHWQWPDGGWNCDKTYSASKSSFIHTAISLRGLSAYSKKYNNNNVLQSVKRASEVLLKRNLYKKQSNNEIINKEFTYLHYPLYWHYDILGALKIMAEAEFIKDERCKSALNLLLSKYIPNQGWPAEKNYYKTSDELKLGNDYVNWGGISKKKMNEWVTVDALYVLKESGLINSN